MSIDSPDKPTHIPNSPNIGSRDIDKIREWIWRMIIEHIKGRNVYIREITDKIRKDGAHKEIKNKIKVLINCCWKEAATEFYNEIFSVISQHFKRSNFEDFAKIEAIHKKIDWFLGYEDLFDFIVEKFKAETEILKKFSIYYIKEWSYNFLGQFFIKDFAERRKKVVDSWILTEEELKNNEELKNVIKNYIIWTLNFENVEFLKEFENRRKYILENNLLTEQEIKDIPEMQEQYERYITLFWQEATIINFPENSKPVNKDNPIKKENINGVDIPDVEPSCPDNIVSFIPNGTWKGKKRK